jgi:hydroxyacylglutathione hydrolase
VSMLRESYRHWRVGDSTVFITMLGGTQYMYLLEGSEQSLLVDTGWGCGPLRKYVERLTDKPICVVNTHGHPDHVGGNGWWPEVHIHAGAVADLAMFPPLPERLELPWPGYRKVLVGEGFVFGLGGREVEVIEMPAHASGSIALLDRQTKMLFSGDEIEAGQVLLFDYRANDRAVLMTMVEKHLSNMLKLKAREAEFSSICPAHNGAPIACSHIDDFIELDRAILEGRQSVAPRLNHWYLSRELPFASELRRASYGKASIIYRAADE